MIPSVRIWYGKSFLEKASVKFTFFSESNLSDPSEISVHVLCGKEEPRSQNDVVDEDDGSKASVACLGLVFDHPNGNRSTLVVGLCGQVSLQKYCRRDTG